MRLLRLTFVFSALIDARTKVAAEKALVLNKTVFLI